MGILEFLGLTPLRRPDDDPADGIELQELGLGDAARRQLEDVRQTVAQASVHDHDEAIRLLSRAARGLQAIAARDDPRVAELREEIDQTLAERAGELGAAVAIDSAGWQGDWTDASAPPDDPGDEEERDQRVDRLGTFVARLRADLARHDRSLQALRGTAGAAAAAGAHGPLNTGRTTLQQAVALLQRLEEARAQAPLLDELREARGRCRDAISKSTAPVDTGAFVTMRGEVDDLVDELVTPDQLAPAQAANEARRLIDALDALARRVVAEHHAALKSALEKRLALARERLQRARLPIDQTALQGLEARIAALAGRTEIDGSDDPSAEVEKIETDARYADLAQATRREKLPMVDEARRQHAGTDTATPLEQLAERMAPGRLDAGLGPGPLGEASPHFDGSAWPEVKLVPAGGKFRFAPTQARESGAHVCVITPIGQHDIGEIDLVAGKDVSVTVGHTLFTFRAIANAKPAWKGRMLQRGVSKETYKQIELRELEHLVDFSYAFKISAGRVAAALEQLGGESFDTEDQGLTRLIESLGDARALIPEDPRQPGAWVDRLRAVANELAGFSIDRDKRGTHSPAGNVARESGGAIVIEPDFKSESLVTADIISLARIDPVFTRLATAETADQWALNASKRVKATANADYHDAVNGKSLILDEVPAGAQVNIAAAPTSGRVWVSCPAAVMGSTAGYVDLEPQDTVYFLVRTDNLE